MLSITYSTHAKLVNPNILPCQISHTGKVNVSEQFWNPQVESTEDDVEDDEKGVQVVYFRGKKLLGRTTELPEGYTGVIVSGEKTAITQPEPELESLFSRMARRNDADDDNDDKDDSDGANDGEDDAEDQVPLESMDQVSRFQDITVWNHEMVPSADESFSRGVNEWLAFAQVIHGTTLAES